MDEPDYRNSFKTRNSGSIGGDNYEYDYDVDSEPEVDKFIG